MRRMILGAGISPLIDPWRRGGVSPVDPAFLVTNGGEAVTYNGIPVTNGTGIDPELLVTNDGRAVTNN